MIHKVVFYDIYYLSKRIDFNRWLQILYVERTDNIVLLVRKFGLRYCKSLASEQIQASHDCM